MLLAIDIGNTNITLGLFRGKKLIKKASIPSNAYSLRRLNRTLSGNPIDAAIICSVVPALTKVIAGDLKKSLRIPAYIIGRDIKVPIKNLYRNPRQVGIDRLVNAYAGIRFYGAPLVVIDFGTAITLDVISKKKAYLGGMILPGLSISLEALNERTALLPKIKLKEPKEFIGRDTANSMLSGIFYGFGALASALSKSIKEKIGKNAKVIGTGGNIKMIAKYCRGMDYVDSNLTLKGINLLYSDFV